MSSNLHLDDVEGLQAKVDAKAGILFLERENVAPLYVSRTLMGSDERQEGGIQCAFNQEIRTLAKISELRKSQTDTSQIFHIRQRSSWNTIDTSREIFEGLMAAYNIFPQFWKCVLTFGIKEVENEFEFPPFRSRRTWEKAEVGDVFESSYMLRRVELNGRRSPAARNAWSIRQTAVYHRFKRSASIPSSNTQAGIYIGQGVQMGHDVYLGGHPVQFSKNSHSTFVLIAMSKNAEQNVSQCLEQAETYPWNVQRLLVADSLRGWSDYMACLSAELNKQSKRIVTADVGPKTENLPALTDIFITFEDRQELKKLQDAIHDLQVILPATLQTLRRIRHQCKKSYNRDEMSEDERLSFDLTLEEFDEHVVDAELHVERAGALEDRAKSTTKLMSDLLSYEEAVALKELAKESHKEGESMHKLTVSSHHLTARSTQDAAAMKILTIITLIYLPTTIVANFFSTQFVQKDESGNMQVAKNVWLLAAISIPLTLFTILLWWGWVTFTKVPAQPADEHTLSVEHQTYPRILRRGSTLRSLLPSSRRKKAPTDEESGQLPSSPNQPSPSSTFKSDASTVKGG